MAQVPATLTVSITVPAQAAHLNPDAAARHIALAALDDVRRAILDPRQSAGEMRHSPRFGESEIVGSWQWTPAA